METRIVSIEIELAKLVQNQESMNENLRNISKTLEKIVELQTSTQLLNQRVGAMEANSKESFRRVYEKIEGIEGTHKWISRTIIGAVIAGIITGMYTITKG